MEHECSCSQNPCLCKQLTPEAQAAWDADAKWISRQISYLRQRFDATGGMPLCAVMPPCPLCHKQECNCVIPPCPVCHERPCMCWYNRMTADERRAFDQEVEVEIGRISEATGSLLARADEESRE